MGEKVFTFTMVPIHYTVIYFIPLVLNCWGRNLMFFPRCEVPQLYYFSTQLYWAVYNYGYVSLAYKNVQEVERGRQALAPAILEALVVKMV